MSEACVQPEDDQDRKEITHRIIKSSAESMDEIPDSSVQLIVTSPPYWNIKDYGNESQIGYNDSLEVYLDRLESVWAECYRVLHPGCRMAINIGDQYVSSTDDRPYQIIPLNALIVSRVLEATNWEIIPLGNIIWQKQTNTETSGGACVMGSFGRPRNGYVNYDYEYISIFKKPGKSPPVTPELKEMDSIPTPEWKQLFNGHWNFAGDRQKEHPAPFPKELPRRLIRMFSFTGDTVLDPFLGRGTTMKVADKMGRSSIGYEIGFDSPTGEGWRVILKEYIGYFDYDEPERTDRFNFHFD